MQDPSLKYSPQSTTINNNAHKTQYHLEGKKHNPQLKDQNDARPRHVHIVYTFVSWTLTLDLERKIQAVKMRC
ncbi:hypothetical protein DPMN_115794 [Dreissena polymorpha]|uniref:Uncharacterized protein n=1 Tax=Dreissena polymorpha TaxID=45954 RepID=A0A9D4QTP2_DREPO|nr:hypothetical protein DPMN_115794 [Dreissena polymorpha]